ncbi:hypothetical protein BH23VER1_BH23VER1_31000 [soil metagenome]
MNPARRRPPILLPLLIAGLCGWGLAAPIQAAEHFVAPDGKADNTGTEDSPWDIGSAWSGGQEIAPGATVIMAGGTYRHPEREWGGGSFQLKLAGTGEAPVHIRPAPGARVTIDGGVVVDAGCHHLWVWDLEITVSESTQWDRRIDEPGSHPQPDIDQPQGGLTVYGGSGSKFINLVVHHNNGTGISFWRGATDAELHGCLIYSNGWMAPDRFHGPGIYTQNETGQKWITDNILWGNFSTTIQAYGSSKAWVDGFRIIGNIAFAPLKDGQRQRILIGGGRPSKDIVANENILYEIPLQLGYSAPHNEDATVHDNRIVNAGLDIQKFRQVDEANNTVLDKSEPRPDRPADTILRPNKYDPDRANLAIFNWSRTPQVDLDPSAFLQDGDRYRIVSALDYFGDPVAEGTFDGNPVPVPVPAEESTGDGEFCAYVVFRIPE